MATDLEKLAARAEIPLPPAGWTAQARYDYLVQHQQRASDVMRMLPEPSAYGAVGDVVQAADAFRREFTSQSSSFMSIISSGANVLASVSMGKFLSFLWVAYLSAQRGMALHQPAYQQATMQAGSITATLLELDYKVRLAVFYLMVKAADSGMLDPMFRVKSGQSGLGRQGLGEPLTALTVTLIVAVVFIIALVILFGYLIYEHNKIIELNCVECHKTGNAMACSLCEKLSLQQGAAIAKAAEKAAAAPGDIINALKWVGIAYVAVMLAPPLIQALSSAAASRRATA